MSSTIQDPLRPREFMVCPTIKVSDIFSYFMKAILLLCTVLSIFLVLHKAFFSQLPWVSPPEPTRISVTGKSSTTNLTDDPFEATNVSHILFGIGGSAKTWNNRRNYSELWWRFNITRGFVWLDKKPPKTEPWPATVPPYKVSCGYGPRSALHIAGIVKESFDLGLYNVRWFVMGDDDTVFFVENLVNVLGKYDHNQMYYIGGNSESVEQDVLHSYGLAFGGAGFAISYPLAKELARILDGCVERYNSLYGSDEKVQACIGEIGVPLTKELGFHQVDIRGNPYGLLASHPLAPLVTLHHLDSIGSILPGTSQVESLRKLRKPYEKDPGRMLQRSFCYDLTRSWSVSVSWGYTVQLYPSLMTAKQLETAFQTFRTWRSWSYDPYTFNTRPMGEDPCERPVLYFFDGVSVGDGKTLTLSSYKKYMDDFGKSCVRPDYAGVEAIQFVNVTTTSQLNHEFWSLAPRRQCCEVMERGKEVVEVKIRGCNQFESVTPP